MTDVTNSLPPVDRTGGGFKLAPDDRSRFAPNYTPLASTRILRSRLYADEGGVATVTFAGTLEQQALWLEAGGSGRLSVYAEVARALEGAKSLQTTLRIAVVPTGKRVPEDASRIGSARGLHAYLLAATVGPLPTGPDLEADDDDNDSELLA